MRVDGAAAGTDLSSAADAAIEAAFRAQYGDETPPEAAETPAAAQEKKPEAVEKPAEAAREPGEAPKDAPKGDEKKEDKPPERDADRWAPLTRQQAAIRKDREALTQAQKALESERSAFKAQQDQHKASLEEYENFKTAREMVKTAPMTALSMLGIETPAQLREFQGLLTKAVLNGGLADPMAPVRLAEERTKKQIAEWEKKRADEESARRAEQEKAQAAEQERVIREYEQSVVAHVTGAPEKYPFTIEADAAEMVPELIKAHYEKTGQIIPTEQAAARVEEHWRKKAEKMASRIKPPEPAKPPEKAPEKPAAKPAAPGIASLEATTKPRAPDGYLSDEERARRADEALAKLGW